VGRGLDNFDRRARLGGAATGIDPHSQLTHFLVRQSAPGRRPEASPSKPRSSPAGDAGESRRLGRLISEAHRHRLRTNYGPGSAVGPQQCG
jgi:hypothetical protein